MAEEGQQRAHLVRSGSSPHRRRLGALGAHRIVARALHLLRAGGVGSGAVLRQGSAAHCTAHCPQRPARRTRPTRSLGGPHVRAARHEHRPRRSHLLGRRSSFSAEGCVSHCPAHLYGTLPGACANGRADPKSGSARRRCARAAHFRPAAARPACARGRLGGAARLARGCSTRVPSGPELRDRCNSTWVQRSEVLAAWIPCRRFGPHGIRTRVRGTPK